MPRHKFINPFLLVIIDEESRIFSIEGPMTDDTKWNKAVCEAQDSGRQIRCFSANNNYDEVVAEYKGFYKYTMVDPGTIVLPAYD